MSPKAKLYPNPSIIYDRLKRMPEAFAANRRAEALANYRILKNAHDPLAEELYRFIRTNPPGNSGWFPIRPPIIFPKVSHHTEIPSIKDNNILAALYPNRMGAGCFQEG